ncbi:hypothetical protein Ssi02_50730 [Sinosporangium siamense]|uniref:HTH cro/C1-type domain-containing protein n=1 Tax=Sinosporangium siamense TaxID=1367973 RepID=A0A919RKC9_9ACTN|nr:hypothetical protein Ssi02_50730 [Sinosporangium siamense]
MLDVFASADGQPVYGLQVATLTQRPTGTVYPLLTRLEKVGWLEASWESSGRGKGPRRRYYRLTHQGREQVTTALRKRTDPPPAPPPAPPPSDTREPGAPVSADQIVAEFVLDLRHLRAGAGSPSLRQLAERTFYSRAALSEAFSGRALPSERLLETVVWACGGDMSEWTMRRNLAEQSIRYGERIPLEFSDFYPLGMRWALSALAAAGVGSPDAEDIAQETLLTAHQRWHDVLSTTPDLRRWVCQQAVRRAHHLPAPAGDPLEDVAGEPRAAAVLTLPDIAEDVVERFSIGDLLQELDATTREIVYRRAAGFSVQDTADMLGMSPMAVYGRLSRARRELRGTLIRPVSSEYAEFVQYLVRLRDKANNPPLREIAQHMGCSHTHIATVLGGQAPLPTWEFTAQLVRVLTPPRKTGDPLPPLDSGHQPDTGHELEIGQELEIARSLWLGARRLTKAEPDTPRDVAVTTDETLTLWNLTDQLERAGRPDQAAGLWRTAAAHGNTYAMSVMAELLERRGDTGEAELWLRRAAQSGDAEAKRELTRLLEKTDRVPEAIRIWRQTRGTEAKRELTRLLEKTGRVHEAIQMWRQAAAAGGIHATMELAALLDRAGRVEEAIGMWRQAAAAGNLSALKTLARRLAAIGRIDEACVHLRSAAAAGDISAKRELATLLERAGRVEEAIEAWRGAAEAGGAAALRELAVLLEQAGFIDEAIETWHRAADAGVDIAQQALARLEGKPISILRTESVLYRAAEAGDSLAVLGLADLLSEQGRYREAEEVLRKAAVRGDPLANQALSDRYHRNDRPVPIG